MRCSQEQNKITNQKVVTYITSLLLIPLLISCGGGSGGTSIAANNESPDPVVLDIPIAYIKRPVPTPDNNGLVQTINLENPVDIFPGARLLIRPRSSNLADEIDITDQIINRIATDLNVEPEILSVDIKDVESSFDGQTLIFAVRAIPDIDNNDEPELFTWNLWTYDFASDTADYLIQSPLIRDDGAASGGGQDMAPHYLTDDRIVFISTRQAAIQERQLNEGRGQRYSAVSEANNNIQATTLHIYDPDSEEISQISLNQTIDLDPATLESGEIIYSHWESNQQISLYQINPSGAEISSLYGANSGDLLAAEETTGTNTNRIHFLQPREMPDGRILSLIRANDQSQLGGDLALIDTAGFIELFTPIINSQSTDSRAQLALSDIEVNALDDLSPGGKFLAAYPLKDGTGRVLTSWSPCRVRNGENLNIPCSIADNDDRVLVGQTLQLQAADSLFGIWIYDPAEQTQLPVVIAEEGFVISEVVAAEPRSFPDLPDETDIFDAELAQQSQGLIIIESVYNEDDGIVNYAPLGISAYAEPGTIAYQNRPARFLRVIQPVPIPNDDVLEDLPNSGGVFGLLEILGYSIIEPDGSVSAKVQADTPLMINIVDADGRRISRRHTHWLQVAKGEILRCVGCHDPNSDIPHGRLDSQPPSFNPGAVSLNTGLEGFIGADPALFASELGQTMAEAYDIHKPDSDDTLRTRDLQLQLTYSDEWTDTANGLIADSDIDLSYDAAWGIPDSNAIISPNLDPQLNGRIAIDYKDHIQSIWDRPRVITQNGLEVIGPDGTAVDSCTDCHTSNNDTVVPAGQLDLTDGIANGILTRSYLELTRTDNEQWITTTNGLADRQRICTVTDINGVETQQIQFFNVPASVNRGSARASNAFFNCFELDNSPSCGTFIQDISTPPANCTDDGGTVNQDGILTTKIVPDTFAEAQVLMAANGQDLTADPELMYLLNTHCSSCHSSTAAGNQQMPFHGDADPDTAYEALKPSVNLVNPAASLFVFKVGTQDHQCWSADCNADAAQLEQAITNFAAAVPETEIDNSIPGGSVVDQGTFNHYQLLSPSELRLISEWLDIGSPFYTNPFDPRLFQ
jgi:hypothetical protein